MKSALYSKVISRFSEILFNGDISQLRLILGFSEILWGLNCLYPGDSFSRDQYAGMAAIMSEEMWGVVFLMSAIIQISIVIFHLEYKIMSRIFSFWNMVIWGVSVFSIFLSIHPPEIAMSGELVLFMVSFWSFLRPILLCNLLTRSFRDSQIEEKTNFKASVIT